MSRGFLSLSAMRTLRATGCDAASSVTLIKTGSANIDARFGGGLARGALHEMFAGNEKDFSAAAGFALLLASRGCNGKPVIWLREDCGERGQGKLYAPGLAELGADPDQMILVTAPGALAVLRAGADIAGCGAVGAMILEPWGKALEFDLTASRRLSLASARSGVMTLVVRSGVEPAPSAAQTRWQVSTAPSRALAGNAPGPPTFDISLLRHRGGVAGFDARVEWDRDKRVFRDAPLSGRVSTAASGRAVAEFGRRAA